MSQQFYFLITLGLSTASTSHVDSNPSRSLSSIRVTIHDSDGRPHNLTAPLDSTLLDVAQDNDIPVTAACGGCCACTTCHMVIELEEHWKRLPKADEEELEMLTNILKQDLTKRSRLGCQVMVTKELDGLILRIVECSDVWGGEVA